MCDRQAEKKVSIVVTWRGEFSTKSPQHSSWQFRPTQWGLFERACPLGLAIEIEQLLPGEAVGAHEANLKLCQLFDG